MIKSHSVMEIDEDGLELNVIAGQYDNPRFNDGPTESGLLRSPVGMACRGSSVYITEHPIDCQGYTRLFQYLSGLKEFQSIRHLVGKGIWDGKVSRKERCTNPEVQMKRRISKLLMLKTFWSWPWRDLLNWLVRYQYYMVTCILISMSGTPAAAV